MNINKNHLRLCLLTNAQLVPLSQYKKFLLRALEGGVTLVQLREKSQDLNQIRKMAAELKTLLMPFNVPLIINDHLEVACEIDADGVHLGQSDLSPLEARKILGPNKIIGWSIETIEELKIANEYSEIDYVAASAIFPSRSKSDCKTYWGLEGLRKISELSRHPVMAIGGINQENIRQVMENGACGVALIDALHTHSDPKKGAALLLNEINSALENA